MKWLERAQLAFDRAAEHLARLGIHVVAQQEARAVADVLDRVRQVVDEAGGDAAEHRLALLPLDVLLQLDQLVGHRVERLAELGELVAGPDVHAFLEVARREGLGAALQREDRRDELAAEEVAARGSSPAARPRSRRRAGAAGRWRWRRLRWSAARRSWSSRAGASAPRRRACVRLRRCTRSTRVRCRRRPAAPSSADGRSCSSPARRAPSGRGRRARPARRSTRGPARSRARRS